MFWDFTFRLVIAGILGALIGLDREYRAKEAGFRTHFLVSLGSALIMIVSQYGFQDIIREPGVSLDPSRVAAQVVSGIGFIGAGTIILQKQIVRGLTTAAGLWATAGIGLAIGSGMYWIGISATILTLIGLEVLGYFFKSLGMHSSLFSFTTTEEENLKKVVEDIHQKGFRLVSYKVKKNESAGTASFNVTMVVKTKKYEDENYLFQFIQSLPHMTIEGME
ncbi:MAG: MgtC/SapB family protein [Bacteroidales bacterium]|nr:MgtC/SapB family protein [Bacteroidales bacterium]